MTRIVKLIGGERKYWGKLINLGIVPSRKLSEERSLKSLLGKKCEQVVNNAFYRGVKDLENDLHLINLAARLPHSNRKNETDHKQRHTQ